MPAHRTPASTHAASREAMQWVLAFCALAAIVATYHRWLPGNPTTVALTLLLFILVLAARSSLRLAVAVSFAATACYNFFFLPPVGTFTIADPQNWLALFAFLATGVIGSRLAQRARHQADQARTRQREIQILFTLSRDLLQTDNIANLVRAAPQLVATATGAHSALLYLLEGNQLFGSSPSSPDLPTLRQLALTLAAPDEQPPGHQRIPLRAGVRPRGLLLVEQLQLSPASQAAIGGLVSVALDRAQALEELARSQAAEESERLRTLILDAITHQLRTPLTSIKGAASALLHASPMGDDDRRELLTIVDEEADRLNHLLGQAVEMARLQGHEVRMNLRPLSLARLIRHAQQTCSSAAATHPITVQLPPLPSLTADEEMVGKLLCNLIENAAKYSPSGSPILITAQLQGDSISTSITDYGIGIDPAEQALIFDRLYRAPTPGTSVAGTGMGLAISRAIVESHHGTLSVTSQPGQGSTFTFSLPVSQSVPQPSS